jgi:hypothetical protein
VINASGAGTAMTYAPVMFSTGLTGKRNLLFIIRLNAGTAGPVGWNARFKGLNTISPWG